MNLLIQKTATVNRDLKGSGSIGGRGLVRRHLTHEERTGLAADVVAGKRSFEPSMAQTAQLFGVTVAQIRNELKAVTATLESEQAKVGGAFWRSRRWARRDAITRIID
jgi:hypothetical protein